MSGFLNKPIEPTMFPPHSDMRILASFRRTMPEDDQTILDDLLGQVDRHWPLESSAANLARLDLVLLTILLEQQKEIRRLHAAR